MLYSSLRRALNVKRDLPGYGGGKRLPAKIHGTHCITAAASPRGFYTFEAGRVNRMPPSLRFIIVNDPVQYLSIVLSGVSVVTGSSSGRHRANHSLRPHSKHR